MVNSLVATTRRKATSGSVHFLRIGKNEEPTAPYKASLIAQKTICSATSAFYFRRPHGFQFEAGQFASFTLLRAGDSDLGGTTRTLSIASAPHEKNLMVAMRLRETAFKRNLNSLPIGAEILLQGPYGWMTLSKDGARPAVLLAGGIGITLFRSLIWNEPNRCPRAEFCSFIPSEYPRKPPFSKNCRRWSITTGATNSSARSHNRKSRERRGGERRAEFHSTCFRDGFQT